VKVKPYIILDVEDLSGRYLERDGEDEEDEALETTDQTPHESGLGKQPSFKT
jgi:hypothetical protein